MRGVLCFLCVVCFLIAPFGSGVEKLYSQQYKGNVFVSDTVVIVRMDSLRGFIDFTEMGARPSSDGYGTAYFPFKNYGVVNFRVHKDSMPPDSIRTFKFARNRYIGWTDYIWLNKPNETNEVIQDFKILRHEIYIQKVDKNGNPYFYFRYWLTKDACYSYKINDVPYLSGKEYCNAVKQDDGTWKSYKRFNIGKGNKITIVAKDKQTGEIITYNFTN